MNRRRWSLRALACGLMCVGAQAWSLTVAYTTVDLPDTVVGADRWRYDYSLSGDLGEFEGLNLLFGHTTSAALQMVVPPDPAALAYFVEQPNPALSADGMVNVSAVRTIAGERFGFSLAFDRLGTDPPGAQPFELFDADFNLTGTGLTTPVPEPATAGLWLVAWAALSSMLLWQRARRA